MNRKKLYDVKLKQNDIKIKEYLEGSNEHCFNMSLFVMAANAANVYQPNIELFYDAFEGAIECNYVDVAGWVYNSERLSTYYYNYMGGKGYIKRIKNEEIKKIEPDYIILHTRTMNDNYHFKLIEYDPWKNKTITKYIIKTLYYKINDWQNAK